MLVEMFLPATALVSPPFGQAGGVGIGVGVVAGGDAEVDELGRVAHTAPQIARQGFGQADGAAVVGFDVLAVQAVVIHLAVEEVNAEDEPLAQEPGFGEGDLVVLVKGAEGGDELEFLPGAGEGGGIEEVEVLHFDFGVADDAFDGAEARADGGAAHAGLLEGEDEVFAVGHVGVLGRHIHLGEILHLFKDALADFDVDHVIDFAGINGQFAADDTVLGFFVALDVNFFDGELARPPGC